MQKNRRSSKLFHTWRQFDYFWLYSPRNKVATHGQCGEDNDFLTTKSFPCLNLIEGGNDEQALIKVTVEVVNIKDGIRKYGPIYKGKFYKKRR